MLKARICITTLAALTFMTPMVEGQKADFKANSDTARHGISSLKIEKSDKTLEIDVMDGHKRMARLIAEFDTPEGTLLDLEHGKSSLRMTWSQQTGRFTLTENKTKSFVARTVSMAPSKSLVTEGDASLVAKYQDEVDLTFTILDQVLEETGLYEFFRRVPEAAASTETFTNFCPPGCNGPLVQPLAVAGSRSRCCAIATNDANVECSNSLCFGCCRILGCDAICGVGDFACVCTALGQACSESVLTCDDTWPPECT